MIKVKEETIWLSHANIKTYHRYWRSARRGRQRRISYWRGLTFSFEFMFKWNTRILLSFLFSWWELAKDYVGVCRLMGSDVPYRTGTCSTCRVRECGGQVQHGMEHRTRQMVMCYWRKEKEWKVECSPLVMFYSSQWYFCVAMTMASKSRNERK